MKETRKMLSALIQDEHITKTLEEIAVGYQYTFDPALFAAAFDKIYLLATKLASKYYSISDDVVASITTVTLDKALQLYDPNRNTSFSSYFYFILNNEFKHELAKTTQEKDMANYKTIEIDENFVDRSDIFTGLYNLIPAGLLTEREMMICEGFSNDLNMNDLAPQLGISSTRVGKIRKKIAKKLYFLMGD